MTSYAHQKDPARSAFGFGAVVLLHAILIWALIDGLGHRMIQVFRPTEITTIVPNPKKLPEPLPPAVAPAALHLSFSIPMPIVHFPIDSGPAAITPRLSPQPQSHPVGKRPLPPATPDTNVSPSAISGELPAYPDAAASEGIEGTATIKCDVEADGSTSHCAIMSVTGSSWFGSAALEFVKTHKLHPATHNGLPVQTVGAIIPYRFALTDAQ